jgi:hypothetical protein
MCEAAIYPIITHLATEPKESLKKDAKEEPLKTCHPERSKDFTK